MMLIIIIVGVWQGLTRSNKQGQGPVGVGSGRKVLTRVGKCWHGPAWSNKGKHMLAREIHSENIEYNKIIMTYSLQTHCLSEAVIACTYS